MVVVITRVQSNELSLKPHELNIEKLSFLSAATRSKLNCLISISLVLGRKVFDLIDTLLSKTLY